MSGYFGRADQDALEAEADFYEQEHTLSNQPDKELIEACRAEPDESVPERVWLHMVDADCWCCYHVAEEDDVRFLTEFVRFDVAQREKDEVWEKAIQIIAELECAAQFSDHWRHGFDSAQFLSIERLEAARKGDRHD